MKRLLLLLLLAQSVQAQNTLSSDDQAEHISGDPYLLKEWLPGKVIFPSGRVLTQFKLKFNVARNQLVMQFQGSTFAAESKANGFVLFTGSRKHRDSMVFHKGFPETDRASEETYYQVLLEGPATLLKLNMKQVVKNKEVVTALSTNYYQDIEAYYLFRDSKMILLPDNEQEILNTLGDADGKLAAFIAEKKLRFKSSADFIALIAAYNQRRS